MLTDHMWFPFKSFHNKAGDSEILPNIVMINFMDS